MDALHVVGIFLLSSFLAVLASKRLGLGSILGYLVAGMLIGPYGAGFINDVENILSIAELGVILLLFVIGLELQPNRLYAVQKDMLLWGSMQMLLSTAALGGLCYQWGIAWPGCLIAGMTLAFSSTAFVLQFLAERNEQSTSSGQLSFAILLFQDLAVIPILSLLPLLQQDHDHSVQQTFFSWKDLILLVISLTALFLGRRKVLSPLMRFISKMNSSELLTTTTLLLIVLLSSWMHFLGLSVGLGAFIAGLLLADSEYRHTIEAHVEPFKGLLLALFFMGVGMSANLVLLMTKPHVILAWCLAFMGLKMVVLFVIGLLRFRKLKSASHLSLSLSQGGEFAFVLLALAQSYFILNEHDAQMLIAAVILSMVLTPVFAKLYDRLWALPFMMKKKSIEEPAYDVTPSDEVQVIIAGFGRVGQIVGRILRAKHIPFTAMDKSSEHLAFIHKFGVQALFGDACRLELLKAARVETAKLFVLAIDDVENSIVCAKLLRLHFPQLKILARARNRLHAYALIQLGVHCIVRETFLSSVDLACQTLEQLNLGFTEVNSARLKFIEHDEKILFKSAPFMGDEAKLQEIAYKARQDLESVLQEDMEE